jgi:hypothetical protein
MWRKWVWGQIRSRVIILALLVAVGLVALGSGVGPLSFVLYPTTSISANGGVTDIEIQSVPEGRGGRGLLFARVPTAEGDRPLTAIERFIPDPLPPPLFQGLCGTDSMESLMVVNLGNGKQRTYGPCGMPASIEHLWAEMRYVASDGQCAPGCGRGGTPGP